MVDLRGKTEAEEKKQEEVLPEPRIPTKTSTDDILRQLGNVQSKIQDNSRRLEISPSLHPNDRKSTEKRIKKLRASEQKLQARLDALNLQPNNHHPSWEF